MLKILSVIWVSAALVGTYAPTHSIEKAAFIASAVLIGCVLANRRFRPEVTSDTAPPPIFPTFVPRTLAERREQAMKEADPPLNVRLSYPSVRRPADSIDLMQPRAPSFTMQIANKQSPFTFCWMMSSLMGGMMPAMSALVGYNPQKLLPPPGPTNRPMSVWDPETILASLGDLFGTSCADMAADYDRQFQALMPKPAKPVRYYIAGGHFDMLPPGTFDLDDEYIMFDRGSPTGRRLAPFVPPRWGESGVSPLRDIERFRDETTKPWPHKVAVVKVESLDFGLIEARVLAAMGDKRVRGILLDIESAGGEIVNPQLDLCRQAFMHAPVQKKVAKKAPPAYLQHDPTKRHKRRRKGK